VAIEETAARKQAAAARRLEAAAREQVEADALTRHVLQTKGFNEENTRLGNELVACQEEERQLELRIQQAKDDLVERQATSADIQKRREDLLRELKVSPLRA